MATSKSSTPKTRTFPNTAAGREKAVSQAKRQGEPSITFKLGKPKATRKK